MPGSPSVLVGDADCTDYVVVASITDTDCRVIAAHLLQTGSGCEGGHVGTELFPDDPVVSPTT
ncbi:hypothetical protein MBOT_12720 [Mycobacterium botniense]|uniref:Uncharacterized protein n=1 Tax=Mycobacterium botniense TaxID=84962 RepID=A0A7I9XVV1_9MYCO|nr:hypothetical protein MBOT_12720 [Mycobacterium botniense]